MYGGVPGKINDYSIVVVKDLKIYVHKDMSFTGETAKIVDFVKRNGKAEVGVSNVNENN